MLPNTFDFFSIISIISYLPDATLQPENNPADSKQPINTSSYLPDNGYSVDNPVSGLAAPTGFGNNSLGNSSALASSQVGTSEKTSESSYFLLDNLSRHLGRSSDESIGYSGKDQLTGRQSLASKESNLIKTRDRTNGESNSVARQNKSRIDASPEQQIGQSVLQNKMLNEQSLKGALKTGYSAKTKDDQLESAKMFGQRQSNENGQQIVRSEHQAELKPILQQSDYLQQEEDSAFQTIYGVQTPLVQSTLDAMDIYYPTEVLYSNLPLNIKETTRHLDSTGYGHQSIEKQFYSSAKSPSVISMSEEPSVYHYADNLGSLVGPGVNSCDDYVVTFL